jgi:hypothetical protein
LKFPAGFTFVIRMTQNFKALVLTYKSAPVAIREQVSLNEEAAKRLLHFMREYTTATDILVVSTCNRTEIYYLSEQDFSSAILKGLSLIKSLGTEFEHHFTQLSGHEAIQHLFDVSIGLDAQVVGDLQISGQVKKPINGVLMKIWQALFAPVDAYDFLRQQTSGTGNSFPRWSSFHIIRRQRTG